MPTPSFQQYPVAGAKGRLSSVRASLNQASASEIMRAMRWALASAQTALQSRGLAAILRPKSKNSVAVIRAGSMEPEPKGFLQRAQGMAIKGTGALLLLFIAYHVALGALRTIGFWVGSGILGAAAFFAWRMLKGSKKE